MKHTHTLGALVITTGMACAHHDDVHQPGYAMEFSDVERFAKAFDDPRRDEWQRPDDVIAALHLRPDADVLDLGSGTGYFTVRLARKLPQGHVYGGDVEPRMTSYLEARAKNEGLANVRALTFPPGEVKLDQPVDAVLVVDTYHHIDDRATYFQKVRAHLKPTGIVAIVDFKLDSPMGPPIEHRVSTDAVRAEMSAAGYVQDAALDLPYQYVLVFRAAPR